MRKGSVASVPAFIFLGALAACSSAGSGSSGSVSGSVAGTSFTVASEVAVIMPASSSSTACAVDGDGGLADAGCVSTVTTSGQVVVVLLTNRSELTCSLLQAGSPKDYASADLLTLGVFTQTGTLSNGTYPVTATANAASGAIAQFQTSTATCAEGVKPQAASAGSVTLTAVSSTRAAGTYSVTFGTQGTFSGSFDIPICSVPNGSGSSGADAGPPVCQP